jgi:hypothetical protein
MIVAGICKELDEWRSARLQKGNLTVALFSALSDELSLHLLHASYSTLR